MAVKLDKISYKDKLKNITYEFEEGKITGVLAASGNGKTLLSYIIGNIEKEYTGTLTNTYIGREIGYIFQNPEETFIFDTVREELAFGLEKYNYKLNELEKRINDSLKMVGLPESYLDNNPHTLSSGEKFLLSIAITLVLNPKLIIIDEISTYLDSISENYLIKLLKKIKNNYKKTIIVFTDDIDFIIRLADNYIILKKGKITSSASVKELIKNYDKVKSAHIEIPKIIEFINTVKKKKNISLELTYDIKELMKDIYRNVH